MSGLLFIRRLEGMCRGWNDKSLSRRVAATSIVEMVGRFWPSLS